MTEIALRRALLSDAPALQKVFAAAYASYQERLKDLPDVSGGLADDIATHIVWIAETDGQIAGGVVLVQSGDAFHLANIAVHPDHGGKGIGRALITNAEDFARDKAASELALATHVGMPGNLALYRHLGWQETGRAGNKVYMVKRLT